MKKTYQIPATKAMRVSTENIMGMTAVSGGYEQGVSGDGSGTVNTRQISAGNLPR